MEKKRTKLNVLILENRRMIATILSDLLEEAGYTTELFPSIGDVYDNLPSKLPALLLADVVMIRPDQERIWESLTNLALSFDVPVLLFSCSPVVEREDVLVLCSPGDFAAVVGKVDQELRKNVPMIGMTLVDMDLIDLDELEVALRVQKELTKLDRRYPLGELLVRLDFITREALEQALQAQES